MNMTAQQLAQETAQQIFRTTMPSMSQFAHVEDCEIARLKVLSDIIAAALTRFAGEREKQLEAACNELARIIEIAPDTPTEEWPDDAQLMQAVADWRKAIADLRDGQPFVGEDDHSHGGGRQA
jgi:hypothetical protein